MRSFALFLECIWLTVGLILIPKQLGFEMVNHHSLKSVITCMQVQELGWRNYFSGLYENIHEEYCCLAEIFCFFKELFVTSADPQKQDEKTSTQKV